MNFALQSCANLINWGHVYIFYDKVVFIVKFIDWRFVEQASSTMV